MTDDDVLHYMNDSWVPATEQVVQEFETLANCTLPKDYRLFALKVNGGFFPLEVSCVPSKANLRHDRSPTVTEFFSFGCPEELNFRDMQFVWEIHEGRIPTNTVPIAEADHDLILLNIKSGQVLLWQRYGELEIGAEKNQVLLSDSFSDFLASLKVEELRARRASTTERTEPFISIEAFDEEKFQRWMKGVDVDSLPAEYRHKLFEVACYHRNARAARELLKRGVVDPKSVDVCRVALLGDTGEIIVALLNLGAAPDAFKWHGNPPEYGGDSEEYVAPFIRAWKAGQFPTKR